MTTLVTGGCGFLGGHLVAALSARGEAVRVLDLAEPATPVPGVQYLQGSILDEDAVAAAVAGVERLYHLAAVPHLWAADPEVFDRVNFVGTEVVLGAARHAGVARAVHCSTEAVLVGRHPPKRLDETADPAEQELAGPYCVSKWKAEEVAREVTGRGLPTVIVNPTAPIGSGDRGLTPPARMLKLFLDGGPPAILDCVLNLVDVRDVAAGMIAAMERGRPGERYILGGSDIRLGALVPMIDRLAGRPPRSRARIPGWVALAAARVEETLSDRVTKRPPQASLTGVRLALGTGGFDSSKAARELGWTARPLDATLADAIAFLQGLPR